MVWERYNEVNSSQQDCPVDEKSSYISGSNSIYSDFGMKSPEFEAHIPEDDFDGSSMEDDTLTVEEFVLVEDVSLVKLEDPEILASLKSGDSNLCDHRRLIGSVEVEAKQGRGRRRKSIPKKTKVADGSCYVWQITKWLLSEDKDETEENCNKNDVNLFDKVPLVEHNDSLNADACDENNMDGYICHYCSKLFSVKKVLERHIIIAHLLSTKNNYPCVDCEAVTFNYKSELVRHMKDFHYICGVCYESYDPEEGLKKHFESHTSETTSYNQCQKTFLLEENLEQPLSTDQMTYACTLCPKKFCIKSLLDDHMQSHSENPFQCKKCFELFSSYSVLESHLETHEDITFLCNFCESTFTRKEDFVKHQNDHALKGEAEAFICSKCDVNFLSKTDFVSHLKLCTMPDLCVGNDNKLSSEEDKDSNYKLRTKKIVKKTCVPARKRFYECPECSVIFKRKRRLLLHIRLHEMQDKKLGK